MLIPKKPVITIAFINGVFAIIFFQGFQMTQSSIKAFLQTRKSIPGRDSKKVSGTPSRYTSSPCYSLKKPDSLETSCEKVVVKKQKIECRDDQIW